MKIAFLDVVHSILWDKLSEVGMICVHLEQTDEHTLRKTIAEYDGIVIRSRIKMNADFLSLATKLKFIARSGAGMENIDLSYCKQHNITCFNSPEGNMQAVAEHGLGMLLMLFNKLKQGDAEVRNGLWRRDENRGEELHAKTVGIVGYGNMGQAFARILSGVGCKVIAYDKYKEDFSDDYAQEVTLTKLQEQADVLSLHLPQTPETHYWLNNDCISAFKKPFALLNTARGKNVDTAALVQALKKGDIVGACLDVLEYEKSSFEKLNQEDLPVDWQYLIKSDKVLLSPHVAGWTDESYVKLSSYLADKILREFSRENNA
jgi:D-3-phosphoglycerate dehydrogenase